MTIVDEVAQWSNSKREIYDNLEFLNSIFRIETTQGEDKPVLVLHVGESEIRLTDKSIVVSQGVSNATQIIVEKGRISFKLKNGRIVSMADLKRVLDYVFRQDTSILADIEATEPITYDADSSTIAANYATGTQDGVLSSTDWNTFNNKLDSNSELTALSNINPSDGFILKRSGVYLPTQITTADIVNFPNIPAIPTFGTIATQDANNVNISGGVINNATINSSVIGFNTRARAFFTQVACRADTTLQVPLTINTVNSGSDTMQVYRENGTVGFRIYNSGSIEVSSGSFFRHSGNQVVGGRRTGWSVPLGTANRTSFSTATVTTSQLAQRVKALIDDLRTHGLIGA